MPDPDLPIEAQIEAEKMEIEKDFRRILEECGVSEIVEEASNVVEKAQLPLSGDFQDFMQDKLRDPSVVDTFLAEAGGFILQAKFLFDQGDIANLRMARDIIDPEEGSDDPVQQNLALSESGNGYSIYEEVGALAKRINGVIRMINQKNRATEPDNGPNR